MPLPVIANIHRVAVRGICPNGQPWVNVLHFKKDPAATQAAYDAALLVQLHNIYDKDGVPTVGTSGWATLGGLTASVVDFTDTPLDGVSASKVVNMPIQGQASGDALPSDTALVITLRTAFRGRSKRGRTYWAGLTEANNDAQGRLLAANATDVTKNWTELLTTASAATATLGVASYTSSTWEPVTSISLNTQFDRQRRRK